MASLENRLDAAIDDLLAGVPVTDLDPELAGLLVPASAVLSVAVPAPSRRLARDRMTASVRELQRGTGQQTRLGRFVWLGLGSWQASIRQGLRIAPVAAVAVMIILIFLSGNALPGQAHYPLKRGVEALRLLGIQEPAARSAFYVELADHRLTELEKLVHQQSTISVAVIESIGQAWSLAYRTPGVDADRMRELAMDHARRLQALIPLLPPHLQPSAQDVLEQVVRLASPTESNITPTPAPSSTALPDPTLTPSRQEILDTPVPAIATPTPVATVTSTPAPTATPSPAAGFANTITPEPTATATYPPATTVTPEDKPSLTPTFTSSPTHTPVPVPTLTPTEMVGPTQTPGNTETPVSTETPESEETETPEPEETEEPEPEETEEPEPEETETPEVEETETPEPEETEEPEPEETETPEADNKDFHPPSLFA